MENNNTKGFFIAVDGPNGAGKSTLIDSIKTKMERKGWIVFTTKEPTQTDLGCFLREFAERSEGVSLACLIAADRYEHIKNEIFPELIKGKIVITDRYVLSSLILQQMDGVSNTFILDLNSQILKPDLQLAIFADEDILQERLSERETLTRFEKNNQSNNELHFMKAGLIELEKLDINIMCIDNNDKLEDNAENIVSYIDENWKNR